MLTQNAGLGIRTIGAIYGPIDSIQFYVFLFLYLRGHITSSVSSDPINPHADHFTSSTPTGSSAKRVVVLQWDTKKTIQYIYICMHVYLLLYFVLLLSKMSIKSASPFDFIPLGSFVISTKVSTKQIILYVDCRTSVYTLLRQIKKKLVEK